MFRTLFFFIIILPLGCFAQFTITGRVLNKADKKPVPYASVFLSNSSVGNKTDNDGAFRLTNAKRGKYELTVSIIGFETYRQTISVSNSDVVLPDIGITPQAIALNEVSIKPVTDPDRERNYEWFKEEFLGTSDLAGECKIINPEILNLDYNEKISVLTASSVDFLEIENDALGYKIRYLLTKFTLDNKDKYEQKLHYEGSALFEEMKGTPSQERRWKNRRQEVYEGSEMHFLRSALNDRLDAEGFRVLQLAIYANPERPADSLIEYKIKYYKELNSGSGKQRDSLSYWVRKSRLPNFFKKMMPSPLKKEDIIKSTTQQGLFALGRDSDELFITYNKDHHFYLSSKPTDLNDPYNKENTLLHFNEPYAFFDRNGGVTNPNSLTFSGVWGKNRVAELLPVDYEAPGTEQELTR